MVQFCAGVDGQNGSLLTVNSAQLRKMKQSHETRTSLAYESNKANMAHKKDHTHKHEHMDQSTE